MQTDEQPHMPMVAPIEARQSLGDLAYEHIKAAIVAGDVEPNELYSVNQFAKLLGVSRTPVREALVMLERQGMLQMDRNRGFRVTPLTERDLEQVIEVRLMVEVPAIERLAAEHRADSLDAARVVYPELDRAASRSDLLEFLRLDRKFHLALVGGLGNERLVKMVGELRDMMQLSGLRRMAANGQLLEAHQDHQLILDAIADGDVARAGRVMASHIERTRNEWH